MSGESIQSGSNVPDLVQNVQDEYQFQETIHPTGGDNTTVSLILNRTLGTSSLTQSTISSITKEVNGDSGSSPVVELLSISRQEDDIENSDSLFPSKRLTQKKNFTTMKNWAKNSKSGEDVIEIDDNSKTKSTNKVNQSNTTPGNMRNPPESVEDVEGDRRGDLRPEIAYEKPKMPNERKTSKAVSSESDLSSSNTKKKSKKEKDKKKTKKRSKGVSDDDSDEAPTKKKKGSDDRKEPPSKKKASRNKKDESSEEEEEKKPKKKKTSKYKKDESSEEEEEKKPKKKKKSMKEEKKKTKGKKRKNVSDDDSQADEASEDESDPEPEDGFEEMYGSSVENIHEDDDDEGEFIDPGLPYQYCFRVLLKDHTRKPKDLEIPFEVPGEYMSPCRISRSELRMILIDRYKTEFPTIRIDSLEFCFLQELPCPLDTIDNDEDDLEEDIVERKNKTPLKTVRSEKKSKSKKD